MTHRNRSSLLGISALAAATLGVALTGCDVGSVEMGQNDADMTFEQFLANTYQEPFENGVYIINGDEVIVDEKKLEEYYQAVHGGGNALIVHTVLGEDAVWNAQQRQNLSFCISDNFGPQKPLAVAAMLEATADWEAAADVKFQYLAGEDANCNANNNNVLFDVGMVAGQPYLARAFFPGQNRTTRNVLVDRSSFGNLGALTLAGILRHELGHVLGLRHEHTRPESGATQCFEDNNWRPVTEYDRLSVMHYPQCNGIGGRDLELSALDIQGIQAVYGNQNNDPNQPPTPTPGTPQTAEANGSVAFGAEINYEPLAVVPGSVLTATIRGNGDADLYVRFNQAPTRGAFDCRPYLDGSFETCAIDVPAGAANANIMIHGYAAADYTLSVQWVAP